MRPKSRLPTVLLLLLVPGAAASATAAPARPVVAATVAPLADLAGRLAGPAVEVTVLVPPGFEAESYSPAPRQIAALERAVLTVEVGHPALLLESRFLAPWRQRHPAVARVALRATGAPESASAAGDPHLWTSVRAMRRFAAELARALGRVLPGEATAIGARAADLDAEIAALDAELTARFAGAGGRAFYIFHPALGAFAADYGLEQRAIERDGKEPGPARLAELVASARRAGARAVLVQRGTPARAATLLAGEIGARTIEIDPMPADWLDGTRRIGAAVSEALAR